MQGLVTGIGLVNLVHSSGETGDFLPLDFRVYAPAQDGLTKNDHFQAMFKQVVLEATIQARTLLFDSWYASSENLKVVQPLDTLEPRSGVEVRLQQVPFGVKLFKLVATDGSIEWVITNHLAAHLSREMVLDVVKVR